MATLYEGMTINDFNNYFGGCYCFHYNSASKKYIPYYVNSINRDEQEFEPDDYPYAYDAEVALSEVGPDGRIGKLTWEGGDILFTSRDWIMYRVASGYIPISGGTHLLRVALEPRERRMCKGTYLEYLRVLPLVDTISNIRSPELVQRLTYANYNPHHAGTATQVVLGIAEVLSYGHMPASRGAIPSSEAKDTTRTAVVGMLTGGPRKVVVPTPELAVVKMCGEKKRAVILNNGRMIGKCALVDDMLIATIQARDWEDRTVRRAARKGVSALLQRTFTDNVVWEE